MKSNILKHMLLIITIFSINTKNGNAQSQKNQVKIGLPIEFLSYWSGKSVSNVFEKGNQIKNKKYWKVFSDGLNNKTYKTSSFHHKEVKYDNLSFLQSFVVSEIDSETKMIHLMEPNKSYNDEKFPFLTQNAKDYGWISINNVIPSAFPKTQIKDNDKNYQIFTEKALCMHVVNDQDPNAERKEIKKMNFYEGTATNVIAQSPVQGEYPYYVYAKKDGRVLLSKRSKLDMSENLMGQQIAGWINDDDIQIFSNRLCWEPNWGDEVSDFYKDYTFGVYDNHNIAKRVVSEGKNFQKANKQPFKLTSKRQNKSFNRMYQQHVPDDVGVVEVLILGNPNQKLENVKKKVQKQRNQLRNMNVLFVIDATKSMDAYFPAAAEAIKKSMLRLKNELKNGLVNSLKFAVGIYRDELDGEGIYDYKDFTEDSESIINYLNNVKCYSHKDDDAPESVFQGLIKSMKNFKKDQKNILIWVGDAGNRRKDADSKKQEIIQLANYYDVNWAVFQINRTSNSTYDYFNKDANEILNSSAKNMLKKIGKPFKPGWEFNDSYSESELDLYPNNNKSEGYIMFASIKEPENDNRKLSQNEISNKISDVIINMHDYTVKELKVTKNVQNTKSQSEPMYDWLKRKGYSDDEIKILRQKSFRFKGFLPLKINSVYDDWGIYAQKDVVMLTSSELKQKKEMMNDLAEAADKPNDERRSELLNVFVKNMYLILGVRQNGKNKELKKKIYQMSFDNLWMSLFGISYEKSALKKTKVSEIIDDDEDAPWNEEEIEKFVKKLTKSNIALNSIDNTYEFVRENGFETEGGDNLFYYLPRDKYFP